MFIDVRNLQERRADRDSQFEGTRDIRNGYLFEVNGSVEGDREGLIWFKALDGNSEPFQVFYNGVIGDLRANMFVKIERNPKDPARWQVSEFDTGIYFNDQSTYEQLPSLSAIPAKADYEWPPGFPGAKALNIFPRAITDFAVRPTSPASMKARVYSGIYPGATNYARFQGPVNTKDFTADVPGAGLARLAAISIDSTGTLNYTNGTTFVDGLPMPDASLPAVPASQMLISAIRLVNGMTAIEESNFDLEMRPLMANGTVNVKVSEVWESDFGAAALQANADGDIGIGTATIPHGGVGIAKFAIEGANASASGPHVQITTASDDHSLLQILPWTHDNISINFDAYFNGSVWKSSDAGSNFQIQKVLDQIRIAYDSGIAQGGDITWNTGLAIDTSGQVRVEEAITLGDQTPLFSAIFSAYGGQSTPAGFGYFSRARDADAVITLAASAASWGLASNRGTHASPIAVKSGDALGNFFFGGYPGVSDVIRPGGYIAVLTTEDWTATNRGAQFVFQTNANGATTPTTKLSIDQSGDVAIPVGDLLLTNMAQFTEMTAPAAGAANTTRTYAEDNAGTTRQRVKFSSGNAVTIAEDGGLQTYTPTNVVTDRSYDANATSVAELADVLGTLIADFQAAGVLG